MNRTKLLFLLILCLCFCSCIPKHKCTLTVDFENETDIKSFEKRINALDLNIVEVNEGDSVTYDLKSLWKYTEDDFELLCENYDVSVVDGSNEEIITKNDVISVNYNKTSLIAVVSETFAAYFDDKYIGHTIKFVIDGVETNIDAYVDDNEIHFMHVKGCKECLIKAAVYFSSPDIVGDITVSCTN